MGEDNVEQQQDVDTQLAVCVACQKQFINIVMKEQGCVFSILSGYIQEHGK